MRSSLYNCASAFKVILRLTDEEVRPSKKNITIFRFELMTRHMVTNLAENITEALKDYNIRSAAGWTDSTVASRWLKDQRKLQSLRRKESIIVMNLMKSWIYVSSYEFIEWQYAPTKQNQSDIGARGIRICKLTNLWVKVPTWLPQNLFWPSQPYIGSTTESQIEAKAMTNTMTTNTG